jgi:hypothetical protein
VVKRLAMGWMIGGSSPGRGWGFFSTPRPDRLWAHPASHPIGTRDSFPGVKRPGREGDNSAASSAKVKNAWSYTTIPTIRLNGVVFT